MSTKMHIFPVMVNVDNDVPSHWTLGVPTSWRPHEDNGRPGCTLRGQLIKDHDQQLLKVDLQDTRDLDFEPKS